MNKEYNSIGKNKVHINYEYTDYLFKYIFEKYKINIDKYRNEDTFQIVESTICNLKHLAKTSEDSLVFMTSLQEKLESKMKEIISKKSIYYWVYLYRRIPIKYTIEGESKQTVYLYRNILECAFQKYGQTKVQDELIFATKRRNIKKREIANGLFMEALKGTVLEEIKDSELTGIFLGKFGKKEMLEIYNLERLAFEYWHTTVRVRRINKGGRLKIANNKYWVENDIDTEFLMASYDNRFSGIEDLVSSSGITLFPNENTGNVSYYPKYNAERLTLEEYPSHELFGLKYKPKEIKSIIPNFLLIPINFDEYYTNNMIYSDSYRIENNYELHTLIYTLHLIMLREYEISIRNGVSIDNLNRSYRHIISHEILADELIEIYEKQSNESPFPSTIVKGDIIKCLYDLTLHETSEISLTTLGPRYLIYPALIKNYIIDYSSIMPILSTKMHFLSVKEDFKGILFEDVVIDRLRESGFVFWENKKKLKHNDGTSKQIDISFIYRDMLFIGELKANNLALNFISGDKKSLEFRKKKLIPHLNQVDGAVTWLTSHLVGSNYSVPEHIKVIVPFLVTPFIEYIWSKDSNLWFTDTIPRICTPQEVTKLCSDEVYNNVLNKPYIRIIK